MGQYIIIKELKMHMFLMHWSRPAIICTNYARVGGREYINMSAILFPSSQPLASWRLLVQCIELSHSLLTANVSCQNSRARSTMKTPTWLGASNVI